MKKAPMLVGCSSLVRSVRAVLGISSPVFSFQEPGREDEEPSPNHPEEQKDAKATKYHPQTVQHALLQRTPARTNMALWADIKLTARQKEGLGGAHAFLANGVMADPLWRRSCADVQFGLECSGDRGFWAADGDPAKALRKGELRFTLAGEKLQGCWCACAMTASTASATIGC
jgi:hypothetical protein